MANGPADCHTAIDPGDSRGPDAYDPLGPGQPLAGTGIEFLTPAEAHDLLNREGICHNFRWMYWIGEGLVAAEVWCLPPPGVIDSLAYQTDATVVVFVQGETPASPPPVRNDPVGC